MDDASVQVLFIEVLFIEYRVCLKEMDDMRLYASICVFEESASKRWMICVCMRLYASLRSAFED
jgi:hypothetical protein